MKDWYSSRCVRSSCFCERNFQMNDKLVDHLISNVSQLNWEWTSILRARTVLSWLAFLTLESFFSFWAQHMHYGALIIQLWIFIPWTKWRNRWLSDSLHWKRTVNSSIHLSLSSSNHPLIVWSIRSSNGMETVSLKHHIKTRLSLVMWVT